MDAFRTEVHPDRPGWEIRYGDPIMMMGSCFAENIGKELDNRKFMIDLNPFGVLFNPVSIAGGIQRLIQANPYRIDDLFFRDGLWHSFDHHSRFSGTDPVKVLKQINGRLEASAARLRQSRFFFITFGTARVFHHVPSGRIVSNCHKVPSDEFTYELLRVGDIVRLYSRILQELHDIAPDIRIVLTVSPVRYWKDGAPGNQISKATLLLAVSELVSHNERAGYFPAYEIFMDDLRDYRFYDEDLVHPGVQGLKYTWEKFTSTYFAPETLEIMKQVERIQKDRSHIPINPESAVYQQFVEKLERRISELQTRFPELGFRFD